MYRLFALDRGDEGGIRVLDRGVEGEEGLSIGGMRGEEGLKALVKPKGLYVWKLRFRPM